MDKLIAKFMQRTKSSRIANTILKNKTGGLTLPAFETYYKVIILKTVWYG